MTFLIDEKIKEQICTQFVTQFFQFSQDQECLNLFTNIFQTSNKIETLESQCNIFKSYYSCYQKLDSKALTFCHNTPRFNLLQAYESINFTDSPCDPKWIWRPWLLFALFMFFMFLIASVVVKHSYFRWGSFGGLFRKNFQLWRCKALRNVIGQIFALSIIVAISVILLIFTGGYERHVVRFSNDEIPFFSLVEIYKPSNYRESTYRSLAPLAGFLFLITLSYPIASIAISIVHEKETRMREALKMTGTSEWTILTAQAFFFTGNNFVFNNEFIHCFIIWMSYSK